MQAVVGSPRMLLMATKALWETVAKLERTACMVSTEERQLLVAALLELCLRSMVLETLAVS